MTMLAALLIVLALCLFPVLVIVSPTGALIIGAITALWLSVRIKQVGKHWGEH